MNLLKQFLRYIVVGGVAFAFDIGILYLLTRFLGIPYLVSATISFAIGLVVNYYLSLKFVFFERAYSNKVFEFTVFAVIGVVGLLFNDLFLWLITEKLSFYYLYSKIIVTAIVFIWNFSARKFILFYRKDK